MLIYKLTSIMYCSGAEISPFDAVLCPLYLLSVGMAILTVREELIAKSIQSQSITSWCLFGVRIAGQVTPGDRILKYRYQNDLLATLIILEAGFDC